VLRPGFSRDKTSFVRLTADMGLGVSQQAVRLVTDRFARRLNPKNCGCIFPKYLILVKFSPFFDLVFVALTLVDCECNSLVSDSR